MLAAAVFNQNDGDVTKAYYAKLNGMGPMGQLAVALFRAQKRSTAAKTYRGRGFRSAAYEVKNWSLSEVVRILYSLGERFAWGWREDTHHKAKGYPWVLYVDLPTGQCSFHTAERLAGPDYEGEWQPGKGSAATIMEFCDSIFNPEYTACQRTRDEIVKEALAAKEITLF